MNAPVAKKISHTHKLHGDIRFDPYHWMKERDSKAVLEHISNENKFYKEKIQKSSSLIKTLFKEMKARIKENDSTVPYKSGEFFYYARFVKGKEYPIYCRKKLSLKNKEEILLDINKLAKGHKYFSAAVVDMSPDQTMLAYAVDSVGRRFYTIYFKNLQTGQILKEAIPNTTGNWAWANNQTGFFTKQHPETLRSDRVFRFTLGQKKPTPIYFEKEELFNVGVNRSKNDQTIFISSSSFDSSEVHYLSTQNPQNQFQLFLKREKNHEYDVVDGGDAFYIRTNWKAKNFRLMKTSYSQTEKKSWKDVIKHRQTTYLESFSIFKDFIAAEAREKDLNRIEILNRKTKKTQIISFPDPVYVANLATNEEFDTKILRYSYSSLVQPDSVYDYNVDTKKSKLIKQKEVPTYKPSLYKSERQWASAKDGKNIPISLVYKKSLFKKGQNPILIYGYGSYGYSMDAQFLSNIISLLDRGFVFAIAHIRGGQELGRDWYEQGRLLKKKNTFSDFIACTEHLLKKKYAQPGHVYAEGGSAGGLLMGAIVNARPDLYRGVHAAVPFVDVLTTMLDTSLPLTVGEYEQWGNPNQKKFYDYMKSYSPYDNVRPQKYPHMLITTGYHDSQVQYWEPLKWAAKLRDNNTGDNQILMRTEMGAGHSGVTGRFARTHEIAEDYSFFIALES